MIHFSAAIYICKMCDLYTYYTEEDVIFNLKYVDEDHVY